MSPWSRRSVLAAAVTAGLTGCGSTGQPDGSGSPSGTVSRSSGTASSPATSPAGPSSAMPSGAIPWDQLARAASGDLVRPGSAAYDRLRRTPNPRYDAARPLALLEVTSADDVAICLRFAADHGVPVAVRSGGHSYPGWSSGSSPRALVIDCRGLSRVRWQGTSVTLGPGATLGDVYAAVAGRGRALPGGSCPTVGIGGLTLGGGVGVVTRAYGLTCDRLTSAEVVLPDGSTVTASADSEPDLFWALRGGGGGHLGVTTSLTFATVPAPTLSTTNLTWPASAAAGVVPAWFDWLDHAPSELWSTLKLLAGATLDPTQRAAAVAWLMDQKDLYVPNQNPNAGMSGFAVDSNGVAHLAPNAAATYAEHLQMPVDEVNRMVEAGQPLPLGEQDIQNWSHYAGGEERIPTPMDNVDYAVPDGATQRWADEFFPGIPKDAVPAIPQVELPPDFDPNAYQSDMVDLPEDIEEEFTEPDIEMPEDEGPFDLPEMTEQDRRRIESLIQRSQELPEGQRITWQHIARGFGSRRSADPNSAAETQRIFDEFEALLRQRNDTDDQ